MSQNVRGPIVVVCLAAAFFIGQASYRLPPSPGHEAHSSTLPPETSDTLNDVAGAGLSEKSGPEESWGSNKIGSDGYPETPTVATPGAMSFAPAQRTKGQDDALHAFSDAHEASPSQNKPYQRPQPRASTTLSALLDDGAISSFKGRLRLSSDQVAYWPAIERALRDLARTQLRDEGKRAVVGKVHIDINNSQVQKLISAATPLLVRMREDQKSEVRKLARLIGLAQVASQI